MEDPTKVHKPLSLYEPNIVIPAPFPRRLAKKKPCEDPIDFMSMFGKLEINLPFLQAIKIPPLSKFVKDFLAGKSKASGKIVMGENVSAVLQKKLPPKCKDPGMFSLSCSIGDTKIEHAMCDLGASINVMPLAVYNSLSGVELVDTRVVIQLADRSCIHPEGVLENVLVKVHEFVYPADFYVVRMSDVQSKDSSGVLLGRPFLRTARALIDVHNGTICLDYHGEKFTFSIDDAMKNPIDAENVYAIDVIDPLVQEYLETEFVQDKLELALTKSWTDFDAQEMSDEEIKETIMSLYAQPEVAGSGNTLRLPKWDVSDRPLRSDEKPPKLELKPIPETLKYVFLGDDDSLPVIISKKLTMSQEEKLISLLKKHKKAIGWTLADITGISPDVCQHYILLESDAKPVRDPQRKLNPNMREIVLKEILKLLTLGIIYPISDSKWVSPIHMVPKKSGLQVVENEHNELVPMRLVTGWRMCIDYRKLNAATRKDHFPLPFIDQMLERLAGQVYFCFLDGYSGYFQIHVNQEDQEKTTFTCPFGTYACSRMPFGLCNAPGTFQRCMMSIFTDLIEQCIEIFMDDFTVYGDSFDGCLNNLDKVLTRCVEKNLVLNYEKCHFMVKEGIVLGHVVSERGIQVDKAKVDLIARLPYPTNVKEIRGFLGHAGFYRRFIKDFAKIAQPLTRLLQNDVPFTLTENCKEAFDLLKMKLTTAPIIQPPNWELPFELMCDASDYAVGAVLGQKLERESHVMRPPRKRCWLLFLLLRSSVPIYWAQR